MTSDPGTLLLLVRHAEPAPSAVAEDPAAGLSDRGRAQADALGRRLAVAGADRLLHGPLPRAAATAAVLARHLPGVRPEVSEHLADRTPIPPPEVVAGLPERVRAFLAVVPADEADPDAVHLRAAFAALSAPVGAGGERPRHVVLVTHAFVVGWFVREALGAPEDRWIGLNPLHASLSVVHVRPGARPALVAFDDVGHLPQELRSGVPLVRP